MDLKVYTKETVTQPSGTENIITPNVIDIIPVFSEENDEVIINAEVLTEESEELEQACALATIWQRGLDPLDLDSGVRWTEVLLGEINALQLMEDITSAVNEVTPTVTVVFDTVTDSNGASRLKYTLQGVS